MANTPTQNKKQLKELQSELARLQAALAEAEKREGKDAFIEVKVKKNQGRFERIRQKGSEDKTVGKFYIEVHITAKHEHVFVPISIASGKKVAGFMYQIEGTAAGSLATTDIKVRGDGVSQVTVGTLRYAKIPLRATAIFQIQATIRGSVGKIYKIVFTRINYKRSLSDVRYEHYLKEISSQSVTFS